MKVGVNASFLRHPHTGTGAYLSQLLRALPVAAPELDVVLYLSDGGPIPGIIPYPVRRLTTPPRLGGNWAKLLFEQVLFPRAAAAHGCDVLHVPHFAPPFWHGASTVVTVHDLIPLMLHQYAAGPQARAYSLLVAAAACHAAHLLADSKCTARDIVQRLHVPSGLVTVAYLAAGDNCCPVTNPVEIARVQRRYALPGEYIFYSGGYDRRKGVDVLLVAYAELRQRDQSVPPLVLAGRLPAADSAAMQDPRRIIERLGLGSAVALVGAFDEADKPALLSGACCFVFPSVYEGFGLPPLEAMACGTPVVAARAGSVPEVCGDAAVLVRPGSGEALTEGLTHVLGDEGLRRELRLRGRARAERFTWGQCARVTLGAYERAANKKELRARAAPTLTLSTSGGEERCLPSNNRFNVDCVYSTLTEPGDLDGFHTPGIRSGDADPSPSG